MIGWAGRARPTDVLALAQGFRTNQPATPHTPATVKRRDSRPEMTDTTAPIPDESNEPLFKGERLRAAREAAGLTIKELATAAGATSHEEIKRIEQGKSAPSLDSAVRMASALNASLDVLTGLREDRAVQLQCAVDNVKARIKACVTAYMDDMPADEDSNENGDHRKEKAFDDGCDEAHLMMRRVEITQPITTLEKREQDSTRRIVVEIESKTISVVCNATPVGDADPDSTVLVGRDGSSVIEIPTAAEPAIGVWMMMALVNAENTDTRRAENGISLDPPMSKIREGESEPTRPSETKPDGETEPTTTPEPTEPTTPTATVTDAGTEPRNDAESTTEPTSAATSVPTPASGETDIETASENAAATARDGADEDNADSTPGGEPPEAGVRNGNKPD